MSTLALFGEPEPTGSPPPPPAALMPPASAANTMPRTFEPRIVTTD